jgi:L-malate glycosyltransferase
VRAPDTEHPHVLLVCNALRVGGAERHVANLAPALRDRGLDTAVVVLREEGRFFEELREKGISTRFLQVRSRYDISGMRHVVEAVGAWPDAVVSQGLDAQVVGHFVARRSEAPHLTITHHSPEARLAPHRRLLTRLVARWVDGIVAVSSVQVPGLLAYGFPRDRIRVIENGVPEPQTRRSTAAVRSELGLEEADFVALLAATLRPEKRAGVFVAAVAAAHNGDSRIRGLVAGGGPGLDGIRDRARGSDAVAVLGDRADVADLLAASDVVCLTSAYEVSPIVILEAMALARPVVATGVGGVTSVVQDGVTGLLTPVDGGQALTAALGKLVADRASAAAMGIAGRLRYEQSFTLDIMADRYAALIREFTSAPARRATAQRPGARPR